MADKQQSDSDEDKTEEPSAQRIEDFRKEFKGKKLKVSDTLNLGGNN